MYDLIMKICTKCFRNLDLSSFNRKGPGWTSRCKDCLGEYYRAKYKEDPKRRAQVVRAVKAYKAKVKEWLDSFKDGPCLDCKTTYPACVMDFDHREEGSKVMALACVVSRGWSKARILEEVAKCDLVCANCHRIRTKDRRTSD